MALLPGLAIFFIACSENEPPDLHQAVAVINWQLAEFNISRSMYAAVLPDGTPRQWVSYYFSDMGAAERTPEEEHAQEDEREMARALRMPLWPKGVAATHSKPNHSFGKQIVLKWDDARRLVIVEAYVDPTQEPAFVREIPMPKISRVDELARLSAQSNLEMGGSFQSFK